MDTVVLSYKAESPNFLTSLAHKMKVKQILNLSEIRTFNELNKILSHSHFKIFPKLPLRDVIDPDLYKKLNRKEKNFFNTSHFDFTVIDENHSPVFAVEFDGPHHFKYEKAIKKDIRKNKICALAKLSLLRVTDVDLEEIDSISILQFLAYRYIKWKENFENIKKIINEEISEMSKEELNQLTSDGILDPSVDPTFRFDLEYPFPLIKHLIKELKNKYNLSLSPNSNAIWYQVVPVSEEPSSGQYNKTYGYGIYQGYSKSKSISWGDGKIRNKEINVLKEEQITFGMKWGLVIEEDYHTEEAPATYALRERRLPIYFSDIPGGHIPSIVESIVEYLCYKKIREWAINNINSGA